jgi:hypothetical protein
LITFAGCAFWLMNPLHFVFARAHTFLALFGIPLSVGFGIVHEAWRWKRPTRWVRAVVRVFAGLLGIWIAFLGYVFALFAKRESALVIEIHSAGRRVVVIDGGHPGDYDPSCRQFELRLGSGILERYSANTGCLIGKDAILDKQADGTVIAQWVNCGQVPKKMGRITVACEGNVAQPPFK